MKKIEIRTAADALNYKRPVLVVIENDAISFVGESYWIELDRIKTRAALIEWIHHMSGKRWFTNDMLTQFIEVVCEYRKWTIYEDV